MPPCLCPCLQPFRALPDWEFKDYLGWMDQGDGKLAYGIYIQVGRGVDGCGCSVGGWVGGWVGAAVPQSATSSHLTLPPAHPASRSPLLLPPRASPALLPCRTGG